MEVFVGNIARPKCRNLILPANSKGIMSRGLLSFISKESKGTIEKEVKLQVKENNISVGDVFVTTGGVLSRRKVKNIYHIVIKRVPNDFISLDILEKTLDKAFYQMVDDGERHVALPAIGIEDGDLDRESVGEVYLNLCKKHQDTMRIKIIDKDKVFIEILLKLFRT